MVDTGATRDSARRGAVRQQAAQQRTTPKTPDPPEATPIASVDRALVLLAFLRQQGSVAVTEAAGHLGVAPSTAHRLLTSLAFRGFAVQDHLRRYRIGSAFWTEPTRPPGLARLRDAVRPALEYAHAEVGETVQLMVLRAGDILFVDGIESERSLRVVMRRGDTMPAFTSAGGKALLARLPNAELEKLYRSGIPLWPTSSITSLSVLKRRMTRIRRDGYATNLEETEQGVVGVGVALVDLHDGTVGAMTTATPSIRFERTDLPGHVEVLRTAAELVTPRLESTD